MKVFGWHYFWLFSVVLSMVTPIGVKSCFGQIWTVFRKSMKWIKYMKLLFTGPQFIFSGQFSIIYAFLALWTLKKSMSFWLNPYHKNAAISLTDLQSHTLTIINYFEVLIFWTEYKLVKLSFNYEAYIKYRLREPVHISINMLL